MIKCSWSSGTHSVTCSTDKSVYLNWSKLLLYGDVQCMVRKYWFAQLQVMQQAKKMFPVPEKPQFDQFLRSSFPRYDCIFTVITSRHFRFFHKSVPGQHIPVSTESEPRLRAWMQWYFADVLRAEVTLWWAEQEVAGSLIKCVLSLCCAIELDWAQLLMCADVCLYDSGDVKGTGSAHLSNSHWLTCDWSHWPVLRLKPECSAPWISPLLFYVTFVMAAHGLFIICLY